MAALVYPTPTERVPKVWLRSVVCGVDGTAGGREAARQAAELTGIDGQLALVAVTSGSELAPTVIAARVLAEAERLARRDCPGVTSTIARAGSPADGLIRAAADADLLVVGCDAAGRVPAALLRRAPCSVLLARRPPDLPLSELMFVAAGGDAAHHIAAAELAFAQGAELETVSPSTIAIAAAAAGCGLIVVPDDSRAVETARAASCSVLVVKGGTGGASLPDPGGHMP